MQPRMDLRTDRQTDHYRAPAFCGALIRELFLWIRELCNGIMELSNSHRELTYSISELNKSIREFSIWIIELSYKIESSLNIWVSVNLV